MQHAQLLSQGQNNNDDATTTTTTSASATRHSIAKHPLATDDAAPLRSIFPVYDPSVPLAQQDYAPTQLSPTRIPRAVISRQSVYEEPDSPVRSPTSPASPAPRTPRGQWPLRIQTQPPPAVPRPCATDDLKVLWKMANGWQAAPSEGRLFTLALAQDKDAPVYTLSSASAVPFWSLRLDPTSASAHISLSRHDPSKSLKTATKRASATVPAHDASSASGSRSSSAAASSSSPGAKHWVEALTTTLLEEESRRYPPNDGLVALLMPAAATKLALEKADDPASAAAAENECARLVWDHDTGTHFLVHNALAKPFCVTVERNPAYSRTEYTLEHDESPRHLAKLTRNGTGGGWLELDTAVAAQIGARYILDVAVAALLLVAADEDRRSPASVEAFEPPPPPPPAVLGGEGRRREPGRLGRLGTHRDGRQRGAKRAVDEFELDVESQTDSLGKSRRKAKSSDEELPFFIRAVVKLAKGFFVLVIWGLRLVFKCVGGVFKLVYKCVGSKY